MLGKNQRLSRPQMGHVRVALATQNSSTVYSGKTENKRGFKLAVRGDSEAGGLVAPLPCTAYFSKLAGCSFPQQALD